VNVKRVKIWHRATSRGLGVGQSSLCFSSNLGRSKWAFGQLFVRPNLALDQICDGKNQIGIAQMEGFYVPSPPPFFRAFELYDHLTLNPLSFHSHPLFLCFAVIKFGGFTSFVYGHGETHPITFAGRVHVRSSLFNGDCQLSLRLLNDTLSTSVVRERYLDG